MSYFTGYTNDIRQAIGLAISTQRVIQLRLASGWRTLEPYQLVCYRENENDVSLYAYCRDMITNSLEPSRWHYFPVMDIKQIELTNYYFEPLVEYYEQATTDERVTLMAV